MPIFAMKLVNEKVSISAELVKGVIERRYSSKFGAGDFGKGVEVDSPYNECNKSNRDDCCEHLEVNCVEG